MAKLYLLRLGNEDRRIAGTFDVEVGKVKELYADSIVEVSSGLPVIYGEEPANYLSNPQVAVIELFEGEESFGRFKSPGFNILSNVNADDVYKNLVKTGGA